MKIKPRVSIAAVMGVVLVSALGLTALLRPTLELAGGVFLATCAALGLAVVGVFVGGADGRAGRLGFATFGWGYLILVYHSSFRTPHLPTETVLNELNRLLFTLPGSAARGGVNCGDMSFLQTGHCLWSLLIAATGGVIARSLFAGASLSTAPAGPSPERPSERRSHRRLIVTASALAMTLWASAGLRDSRSRHGPGLWAGATSLLTGALFLFVVLGAIYTQGRRRAALLGALLFGVGYLLLIFGPTAADPTWPCVATNRLLNTLRPGHDATVRVDPPSSPEAATANERVLDALGLEVPLRFPEEVHLAEFLKAVREGTKDPGGVGIPI